MFLDVFVGLPLYSRPPQMRTAFMLRSRHLGRSLLPMAWPAWVGGKLRWLGPLSFGSFARHRRSEALNSDRLRDVSHERLRMMLLSRLFLPPGEPQSEGQGAGELPSHGFEQAKAKRRLEQDRRRTPCSAVQEAAEEPGLKPKRKKAGKSSSAGVSRTGRRRSRETRRRKELNGNGTIV